MWLYNYKLTFNKPVPVQLTTQTIKRKGGGKRMTWLNSSFSLDVAINVGKQFLELVDLHFPLGHPLHSICNRSIIKVSYRCLYKILKESAPTQPKPNCNCRQKEDCQVPGECNQNGAIYRQQFLLQGVGRKRMWAKNFKKKAQSLLTETAVGATSLSNHFWKEKHNCRDPIVTWKYLEKNVPVFNPITNRCKYRDSWECFNWKLAFKGTNPVTPVYK